jgi:hypothetical protein
LAVLDLGKQVLGRATLVDSPRPEFEQDNSDWRQRASDEELLEHHRRIEGMKVKLAATDPGAVQFARDRAEVVQVELDVDTRGYLARACDESERLRCELGVERVRAAATYSAAAARPRHNEVGFSRALSPAQWAYVLFNDRRKAASRKFTTAVKKGRIPAIELHSKLYKVRLDAIPADRRAVYQAQK